MVNCETLLFQRPDDAIHRGADKQAEADIASPAHFSAITNLLTPSKQPKSLDTSSNSTSSLVR